MPRTSKPLTKRLIEQATVPPGKKELWLRDSIVRGFSVRCQRGGSKTFVYRYRPRGGGRAVNPELIRIGPYPAISLDDARRAAYVFAGDVARGEDPAKQRAEERRRSRATVGKLLTADGPHETHLQRTGYVNWRVAMSSLRRGLRPYMARDVKDLTRADIVSAINALTPGAATDLRRYARGFLNWTTAQGLTPHNVLTGLRMPGKTRAQRLLLEPKGKALSDGEIVAVWCAAQALQDRAAAGEAVTGAFGGLVQLALLTGLRRGELAGLQHDHVLIVERAGALGPHIHLPAAITKTGVARDLPLTPLMRAVICAQAQTTSPLLFASRKTGGRMRGWDYLVATLAREASVDFKLHDLRRTFRSLLSKLGVSEPIAELCIGHRRADLIERYDKHVPWPEITTAFEKVSEHIASLLTSAADDRSNVVALRHEPRPAG
jgi:integrase